MVGSSRRDRLQGVMMVIMVVKPLLLVLVLIRVKIRMLIKSMALAEKQDCDMFCLLSLSSLRSISITNSCNNRMKHSPSPSEPKPYTPKP